MGRSKIPTDFEDEEIPALLIRAQGFVKNLSPNPLLSFPQTPSKENVPKTEYTYSVKKRSQVILQLVEPLFRRFGIWSTDESRRITAYGGLKKQR
ncbi:hypothetical protein A2686_02985 [Candidatus Woesebacteria bacterium RIFCSPHIGHO2_01_FULL_38_10]|uniref:Uncharacterized protein n=1 Tax=Candidatus Woesebacteria bacterium RIFCSPLOWO2_01_FULL_39_10b TaxID=1802517 RepID=A0A1F8B907_9BACT|nr:MAG: hypothetical protein A2686_02985 [Candidatus Woesebacteria bacterium RIFCSPHIGHO2_01_FULL_38_10]OGM60523.1 MAG: hypothetical protein A2892_00675 [Candidatus Woesebacteria bacterium RIFCSPLOWO2_01_FULL_39_10b]